MLSPGPFLLAAIASLSSPGDKAAPVARVASVEIRAEATRLATDDPKTKLRRELEEELATIDWRAEKVSRSFELIGVLASGESSASRKGAHATITVELVLREPSGALLGRVRGHATGDDSGQSRAALEALVLEAATREAAAALPEAVRKARTSR